MSPVLSVIVPSYNVSSKIHVCFESLDLLHSELAELEVVIVDDRSTDDTFTKVEAFASSRAWVKIHQLEANTGSPSTPRNVGLKLATGKYVFYLDSDDQILPAGIRAQIDKAESTDADMVRSPLIRFDGVKESIVNRIDDWESYATRMDKVKAIVKLHSTTVCALYKREFLLDRGIEWPTDLRLAEDAIFLYSALQTAEVEYSDEPDFVYHVAIFGESTSSTQQYEERELEHHLRAWRRATDILEEVEIDYFAMRGQVAMQAAFQSMIRLNKNKFSREIFEDFGDFLRERRETVEAFTYGPRFAEIRNLILANDYDGFIQTTKIRLLIAGFDLKFIDAVIPYLKDHYQVQVDKWTGHETHDEAKSRSLLGWADAIFCEWMLGNAVWYSKNKHPRQSLTVRMHRFELTRNYGNQIDRENLDSVVAIAPAVLEEMQSKFHFDREIVSYIPNFIEVDKYQRSDDPGKVYNLALVGSLPKLKGFHRALKLLKILRDTDSQYNLTVYGKRPEELAWVFNNPEEKFYFDECDRYIRMNGLENAVNFAGWVDTTEALADKGFVLSMSDLEGSHVAAAEGFASGNITLLRPWHGAEYMYPNQYIIPNVQMMSEYILECQDPEEFELRAQEGRRFVAEQYGVDRFVELFIERTPIPKSVP